jgi:hypothetical protein
MGRFGRCWMALEAECAMECAMHRSSRRCDPSPNVNVPLPSFSRADVSNPRSSCDSLLAFHRTLNLREGEG